MRLPEDGKDMGRKMQQLLNEANTLEWFIFLVFLVLTIK
jgi:hypothetical protein